MNNFDHHEVVIILKENYEYRMYHDRAASVSTHVSVTWVSLLPHIHTYR